MYYDNWSIFQACFIKAIMAGSYRKASHSQQSQHYPHTDIYKQFGVTHQSDKHVFGQLEARLRQIHAYMATDRQFGITH